jgi:hypothetical protein
MISIISNYFDHPKDLKDLKDFKHLKDSNHSNYSNYSNDLNLFSRSLSTLEPPEGVSAKCANALLPRHNQIGEEFITCLLCISPGAIRARTVLTGMRSEELNRCDPDSWNRAQGTSL